MENSKVLIKNLTNHNVGFGCSNYPVHYELNAGQTLPVKMEHLEDAAFSRGFRYMINNGILRVDSKTENYEQVMDDLQFSYEKKEIDNSLSYDEAKKLLMVTPLQVNYSTIKKHLTEGSEQAKKNIADAAIELKVRDYTLNSMIKKATNIDVIKTLELKSTPDKQEE